MMKRNLKIFAGALALSGALIAGGISYNSGMPHLTNSDFNVKREKQVEDEQTPYASVITSQELDNLVSPLTVDDSLTIPLEKYYSEDGDPLYKLPVEYDLYDVDQSYVVPGIMPVVELNEDYIVFNGGGSVIYPDGSMALCSLDGCIGVKTDWRYALILYRELINNGRVAEMNPETIATLGEVLEIVEERYYEGIGKTNSRS